nr:SLC13 family permease [Shewanella sp. NIFS-20-20]
MLVAGLIKGVAQPALLFSLAAISCYLLGYVSLAGLLNHFANEGLVTLMLLMLVSLALEKTRLLTRLSRSIGRGSLSITLLRLSFSTALLSSFTNNTAVVASLIGAVRHNTGHAPTKLLLPLSYAAILGGTLTLIGTSTTLIVNSFVVGAGLPAIGFFEFTGIGAIIVIAGVLLLAWLAMFMPDRDTSSTQQGWYLLEAQVSSGSNLVGKSIQDNHLRALKHLYLVELERGGIRICPVPPGLVLQPEDKLRFSGAADAMAILEQFDGLEWFGKQQARGQNLLEAVISPTSSLVGRSLKQAKFRETFDAAVVAIRRGANPLKGGLGDIELMAGDMLVLAPGAHFSQQPLLRDDFLAISGLDISVRLDSRRNLWVLLSFALTIALSVLAVVPLVKGLSALLLFYLGIGAVSFDEIKRRFPLGLMLVVGSALSLANLMLRSGLADTMATWVLAISGGMGVMGAFILVYLLTLLLTELMTNNAAAALAFPIAYAIALSYGVDTRPFILAVVFGASASFISPYGYQTNMMVQSAGNYRFSDFLRLGLPLSVLYSVLVLLLVPAWFPFFDVR